MKKIIATIYSFLLLAAFSRSAFASTLEFTPTSSSASVNGKVQVNLVLNVANGESVWGYDAYVKFPSANLAYNSSEFAAGQIFATGGKTVSSVSGDYVSVGGYFDTTQQGTTTGGTVATLSFTGKTASSGQIEIVCSQFTNIYSSGAAQNNLFTNCQTLLPKTSFTISGASAGGAISTPQPTATRVPTAAPTSSSSGSSGSGSGPTATGTLTQLPETGYLDQIMRLIYLGGGMIVVGIIFSFGFTLIRCKDSH